ncbi:MFS transporter, AAHS family, 4-hydroxybenzoate transporter [Sphingomonas guangdongensis]|uniref:MFS transporter, AAHS family, 4-hydroxybenzoate transporter n=1 Tax=Sphingomonas guangdongensis TaxID=1141890 RepID=A0A285QZI4_9SPHN|nr:MFS transporter [Sphingomonas guangdongensis]SOB87315.1 MFS transporter, AAHS family, 4-hydroxybenzoate transporter [Sphingomonas guangdongensis]
MSDVRPAAELDAIVDGQRFGRFNLALLCWSFLALFADGFEISSLGLATPHLIREWGVTAGSLGPMLSASLAGIFIGAPLLGTLGDRYGRRFAIILGCVLFGVTTLAVAFTSNVTQIAVLRFLTGVGMGGVMPNAIALNSELSPRRLRAALVTLMFMGISAGSATPPLVALWGMAEYGWRLIFVVGGVIALLAALGLFLFLPESVKYLHRRGGRDAELLAVLRRMRPDLDLADGTRFAPPPAQQAGDTSVVALFRGGLAPVTLLLWVCFATALMANYFLNSWLPLMLEMKGVEQRDAALIVTFFHIGGTLGGIAMAVLLGRMGMLAVAALLLLAAPAVVAFGMPALSAIVLGLLVGFAGFAILGAQFGSNVTAGMIYPTAVRAKGVGTALAIGRLGSVLGPLIGAQMLALKVPMTVLLLALAGPILLGGAAALAIAFLIRRRTGGFSTTEAGEAITP